MEEEEEEDLHNLRVSISLKIYESYSRKIFSRFSTPLEDKHIYLNYFERPQWAWVIVRVTSCRRMARKLRHLEESVANHQLNILKYFFLSLFVPSVYQSFKAFYNEALSPLQILRKNHNKSLYWRNSRLIQRIVGSFHIPYQRDLARNCLIDGTIIS